MKFDSKNVAFGRHETFHLRFAWLSKGFSALINDQTLFDDPDEATVTLGVGKNMVTSIRYWLRAAQLVDPVSNLPTELGSYIFDPHIGVDSFLEDEGTIWLIHWLLASNTSMATTVAWFFSKYHKAYFDQHELRAALSNYLQESVHAKRRPAATTLKNDISVLTRLYAKTQSAAVAEETLDSPLSELGLVNEQSKSSYSSEFDERPELPCEILGFAILQLLSVRHSNIMPVQELVHSVENFVSPGTVFRMTESALMSKLEELVHKYPKYFTLRETAGLRQLFVGKPPNELDILAHYYSNHFASMEDVA